MNIFKNLIYIIPLLIYYFFESIFIGVIIYFIWKWVFEWRFTFPPLTYFDWVMIVFIIKMLLFDLFKISPFLGMSPTIINQEEKPDKE